MDALQYLIDYVNNWRSLNDITYSGKLETDDYIKFAQDLQNEIAKTVSFSMDSSKTLILYTGNNSDGGALYLDIDTFCLFSLKRGFERAFFIFKRFERRFGRKIPKSALVL